MINVVYSTEHMIMPTIIAIVLCILLAAIIITEGYARQKNGQGFFVKPGRFFREDADYLWNLSALCRIYLLHGYNRIHSNKYHLCISF